jgi:hypothetical protein
MILKSFTFNSFKMIDLVFRMIHFAVSVISKVSHKNERLRNKNRLLFKSRYYFTRINSEKKMITLTFLKYKDLAISRLETLNEID